MPKLGLSTGLSRSGIVTPGIVTDNLVMKHMYPAGAVQPLSDGALYLSAVDNNEAPFTAPDHASLDFGTGDFSICFWMMQQSVSDNNGDKICMKKQTDANNEYAGFTIQVNGSGVRSTFYDTDSGAHLDVANVFANDNKWEHFAFVYDRDSKLYVYVDGVEKGTDTALATHTDSIDNARTFDIGYYNDENYLKAYMCNFGIWKGEALTQAQVKSIMWKRYEDLVASETNNLSAWWAFSDNANDSTGTNNGTLR